MVEIEPIFEDGGYSSGTLTCDCGQGESYYVNEGEPTIVSCTKCKSQYKVFWVGVSVQKI